jgi:exodeoxyribonuclease-3
MTANSLLFTANYMRIFSYNVNGLRAAIKKGFIDWLKLANPDIISLQEIKVTSEQLDPSFLIDFGYQSYWFSAEKKGYSGVAIFTKIKPDFIQIGMDYPEYDKEGRLIRADYGDITHLSVYFPSGTSGELRQTFKMKFLEDFDDYVMKLRQDRPNIIISGDINIAHKEIDINFPKRHNKTSGFLPEERTWIDHFLAKGFLDSFRVFNQSPEQYSWWTYRAGAREKNLGWRIDYHLITDTLKDRLENAQIHADVKHSDHCPVSIDLSFKDS